jgi:Tfp pilus assembly protein PilV
MATTIEPLRKDDGFGAAEHKYQRFSATVPHNITEKQVESPEFWVNVASHFRAGDEVRVRADDDSFIALLHVTYANGNQVRLKTVYKTAMEAVDHDALNQEQGDFKVQLMGVKKWCIRQISTAENVKENIPTQLEAMKELADYQKALAR